MTLADLTKLLRPLRNALANMVARAVVQLVNDAGGIQIMQLSVLEGETREGVERFQEYGFTSAPRAGAEAVVLFVGGRRDHGLVVAVDDRRYRVKGLADGEVALYNDAGARVHLKADGTIEAGAGGTVNAVALANLVASELSALKSAISGAAVVAGDGGAAFKANILTALASWPGAVAASKVKAE